MGSRSKLASANAPCGALFSPKSHSRICSATQVTQVNLISAKGERCTFSPRDEMSRTAIWMFELQALFVPRSVSLNRHPFRYRSECLESGLRPQHLEGGSKVRIGPDLWQFQCNRNLTNARTRPILLVKAPCNSPAPACPWITQPML